MRLEVCSRTGGGSILSPCVFSTVSPFTQYFTGSLVGQKVLGFIHFCREQGLINVAQLSSQVEVDIKKSEARLDLFCLFFLKNSLSLKFHNRVRIPLGCELLLLLCEPLSLSNQGVLPPGSQESFLESYQQESLLTPHSGIHACSPALLCHCLRLLFLPLMFGKNLSLHLVLGAPPTVTFSPTPVFCGLFLPTFRFSYSVPHPPFLSSSSSYFSSPCFLPVSSQSHFCFVIFPS